MRLTAFVLATLLAAVLLSACDPAIDVVVANRTDATICFHNGSNGRPVVRLLCGEVKPKVEKSWGVLCSDAATLWVVLTADDQEIYAASATCQEWEDSGAWGAIEERNGGFITTDSLTPPDAEP